MTREPTPRRIAERYVEILRTGAFDELDDILSPDVHDHVGGRTGIPWWKQILGAVGDAFTDTTIETRHILVDGDMVALHLVVEGTHTGRFVPQLGPVDAPGGPVRWAHVHLFRIADGAIIEHWAVRDDLALALQSGAVAAPSAVTPHTDAPRLDGVHHLKLPVSDLQRSVTWYSSRLGYRVQMEFTERGAVTGCSMVHPAGGPTFGLRVDPDRAAVAAGFDYFSIGVPSREAIEQLARRLSDLGEQHDEVQFASVGWILPGLHDPDGHEVRLYTTTHHSDPTEIARVNDPRESSQERGSGWADGHDPRTGLEPHGPDTPAST